MVLIRSDARSALRMALDTFFMKIPANQEVLLVLTPVVEFHGKASNHNRSNSTTLSLITILGGWGSNGLQFQGMGLVITWFFVVVEKAWF